MAYCEVCMQEVESDKTCPQCGAELQSADAQTSNETSDSLNNAEANNAQDQEGQETGEQPKKSTGKLTRTEAIVIGVLVVVALAIGILFQLYNM